MLCTAPWCEPLIHTSLIIRYPTVICQKSMGNKTNDQRNQHNAFGTHIQQNKWDGGMGFCLYDCVKAYIYSSIESKRMCLVWTRERERERGTGISPHTHAQKIKIYIYL